MATAQLPAPQTKGRLASDELVRRETELAEQGSGVTIEKRVTPDEFAQLKIKHAELVDGKVKKLMPTMFDHDELVAILSAILRGFVKKQNLGRVAAGGSFLTVDEKIRVPDVSFVSKESMEGEDSGSYIQKAPTLAVEIVSKTDTYGDVDDKADEFLAAGSGAVWIVNPRRRTVAVHTSNAEPQMHNMGDTISGGTVLPGFELPVADIFED